MRRFVTVCFLCLLALSGCRQSVPLSEAGAETIPTARPSRGAAGQLESAGEVARQFLDAWREGDFRAMHDLLTFRNRELTSFDEFRALYQNAERAMTLEALEYRPLSLTGQDRILSFQYAMTFHSRNWGNSLTRIACFIWHSIRKRMTGASLGRPPISSPRWARARA